MPIGVWVTVTVPDEVKEEFLKVMEIDMNGSRAEEGCLRFDLLDAGGGVYHFYEVYVSDEAALYHKTLPHYKAWADFKAKNMETIGATQTVQKFTFIGEP